MLTTSRLLLRNYELADFERVHIYGSDPVFSQYEDWGPNSEEDTRIFLRDATAQAAQPDRSVFDLAICLEPKQLLIGGCSLGRESPASAVAYIGWAVNPEFQGRGYATEAARELLRFGFQTLGLQLIYATCDARNEASKRVMEKLNLRFAGTIRNHKMQKGVMRDTHRFEMARAEFSV